MDEHTFDSKDDMTWTGDLDSAAGNTLSRQPNKVQKFLGKYYQTKRGGIREDARTGHRIYRLKGYTTIEKINRKFQQERRQRSLRNLLTFFMILVFLIILFVIYNPFTDMEEFKKISGENSYYKSQQTTETTDETAGIP